MKTKTLTVKVPVPSVPNVVRKVGVVPLSAAQTVGQKTSRAVTDIRAKREVRKAQRDMDRLAEGKTWPEAFNGIEFDRLNAAFEAVVSRDFDDESLEAVEDSLAYVQYLVDWSLFIHAQNNRKLAKQAKQYLDDLGKFADAKATPEQRQELAEAMAEVGGENAYAAKWLEAAGIDV